MRSLFYLLILVIGTGAFLSEIETEAEAQEIGFVEKFLLAEDRNEVIKELIPGSQEYYFYKSLHLQNEQKFDEVDKLLSQWTSRYGETSNFILIQNRQALLRYEDQPRKSLDHIIRRLGIRFDHERQVLGKKPKLPSELDQDLISTQRLTKLALSDVDSSGGFESRALEWVAMNKNGAKLTPLQRRHLLQRLGRPDIDGLVDLIVSDLEYKRSKPFGSMTIHHQLLKSQLDELIEKRPKILREANFVNIYMTKLQPNPDVDWIRDHAEHEKYLDRLWDFVKDLAPVHNSLKANVLYHRLDFDRSRGQYDRDRFLQYIKLPKATSYVNPKYLALEKSRQNRADLNSDPSAYCLLPPIRTDVSLVREYLLHFFVKDKDWKSFSEYINDNFLKQQFAEAKIVNGLGDPEEWYSLLSPTEYQRIKDRVDIDFVSTNQTVFKPNDEVAIELNVKNVKTMLVKVFELNTENYYKQKLRPLNTDINLDGLLANKETVHDYDEAPFRRVKRRFEFPEMSKAGAYVVDFIGNGKSSRALIIKGKLRFAIETVDDGQEFTVLDQDDAEVKNARIWLGGNEYVAGDNGKIHIPFSTAPSRQPIVISADDLHSFDYFDHQGESYQFDAGIHIDRESVLKGFKSKVIIRPSLKVNGTPVTIGVIDEVQLAIRATDHDGNVSNIVKPDFKLFEDRESLCEFRVPERVAQIAVTLTGQVKQVSRNQKPLNVSASKVFSFNAIDKSMHTEDMHFGKADGKYFVDLLGKTGEFRPDRAINLVFKHKDFVNPVYVSLRTNESGRIDLGALKNITKVTATSPAKIKKDWILPRDNHTFYNTIHLAEGESVEVPFLAEETPDEISSLDLSLLEIVNGKYVNNHFESAKLANGILTLTGLKRGDYILTLKDLQQSISIKVAKSKVDAKETSNLVLGENRRLEKRGGKPLQVESISGADGKVKIKLNSHDKFTRLHVFANHFQPTFDAYENFSVVTDSEPFWSTISTADSVYLAGRKIGEEYQYILDRNYAKKFPGNMLQRPALILNPWAVRDTNTSKQDAEKGNDFASVATPKQSSQKRSKKRSGGNNGTSDFANLDFLPGQTALLLNLEPNEDGIIEIDNRLLQGKQQLTIVAVNPLATTVKHFSMPENRMMARDIRFAKGLDPDKHFTQQKLISVLKAEEKFTLNDITASKFEQYDSLADIYRLFVSLNNDANLAEFKFILDWPKKSDEEKRALYSKYACHELSFFISQKDPEFFEEAIQPYLQNKMHKTFVDEFLLQGDLQTFLDPWRHNRLNDVEKILLGQRIPADTPFARRYISARYDLAPTSREQFATLFGSSIVSGGLAVDDDFDEAKDLQLGRQLQEKYKSKNEAKLGEMRQQGQSPGQAGASAPGGFGGGGGGFGGRGGYAAPTDGLAFGVDAAFEDVEAPTKELESLSRNVRRKSSSVDKKNSDRFYRQSGRGRRTTRGLYLPVDKTKEWAENNYYKLRIDQQNSDLVKVNQFWRDYVNHDPGSPFHSKYFAEAAGNFTEMMFALSVLDLPFEPAEHVVEFKEVEMNMTAKGPVVVFHEEMRETEDVRANTSILVSQNFFRNDDRYTYNGPDRLDKFVTDEFLIDVPYGCQVVVTNPTSSPQKIDVMMQVPNGAMPLNGTSTTKTVNVNLQPYRTQAVEFYFYFPAAGKFSHYPVHVSQDETLMAFSEPLEFNVVTEPSKIDKDSWAYISQNGTDEDVVEYLQENSLLRLNLDQIAFRMKDKKFMQRVCSLLRQRHVFNPTLWSYALKHDLPSLVNEYLLFQDPFLASCGRQIESKLITIEPVERKWYQHLEYDPLVNARVHQLGRNRKILNDRFYSQYHQLLNVLIYDREIGNEGLMSMTYYLLLQDRIEEAMNLFEQVSPERLTTRLQYDYFAAYLDLFDENPTKARVIANKYVNYPIDRWQKRFAKISGVLKELEGAANKVVDTESRDQQQEQLAAIAPSFEFDVDDKKVTLNYANVDSVTVNYYVMDIELLFSRNPFVQQTSSELAFVKPRLSQTIELKKDQLSQQWELPKELHQSNVLVEISSAGQTKSQAYYANALNVQVTESYGQVNVLKEGTAKRITKAYVKVYARMKNGAVRFYKDGYTDLRGRFDYTGLSTNDLDNVQKFAFLVMSDEHGAVVKEALPPKR